MPTNLNLDKAIHDHFFIDRKGSMGNDDKTMCALSSIG
jgi:hypothetical protein